MLAASAKRSAWWAGAATLGLAKIIENMEIGHNVMHGQWDWMNDPEIHSSSWEWDQLGAAKHWRFTHNFQHHKYTNILGMEMMSALGCCASPAISAGKSSILPTCCGTPWSRWA